MPTTMTTRELERAFRADAAALGIEGGREREVGEVFAELREAYEDTAREYHSIEHIAACLALLDDVRGTLEAPAEVAMAIWFHDAVYATYPFAGSERRSAALAKASCARMGVPEPAAERIAAMVRATKSHELPRAGGGAGGREGGAAVRERDALTLFDIDLAILGTDPVRYACYEGDVRSEYRWVPEGLYRSGRAKVLRAFLARPAIFKTPLFHERFEAPARANLERAIAELTAKTDALVLHATDEHLIATRAARLEVLQAWSDLHYATIVPGPRGASARLGLAFAPDDDRVLQVALDAPHASEIVDRVRSIPDYDRDAEQRGRTSGAPAIVYSYERHKPVVRPLRVQGGAAYRGSA